MNIQSLRIAFRNVVRQRKRSLLLGGAIGFGFMIAVLINSFTGGFVETVEENFSSMFGGHIYVSGSEVSELGSEIEVMRNPEAAFEAMEIIAEDIDHYTLRSSTNATLIFTSNEISQQLVGVDFYDEKEFLASLTYAEGSAENVLTEPNGIIIPEEMRQELGVEIGEILIVRTTTISGQQNTGELVVAATIQDQGQFVMSSGYVDRSVLNGLLDMEADQFQSINIYVQNLNELDKVTEQFYQDLQLQAEVESRDDESEGMRQSMISMMGMGGLTSVDEEDQWDGTKFSVTNLNDIMDEITQLVAILDYVGLGIFIIILVIIMVGIMNSYRMVMIERTSEIGTMRAIGVQRKGIRRIFQYEALLIALLGALAGLAAAGILMFSVGAATFGSSGFSAMFLLNGHLNFNLSLGTTIGNLLIVCAMSLISVYLPARAASRMEPAQALRKTY